jgi:membrane-bound serine protease (ClpP class)
MPKILVLMILLGTALLLPPPATQANASGNEVLWLDVDGPIGPATSDYLSRSLDKAAVRGAGLVVLRMDTPGGLDTSMRDIIQAILVSPVPVVTYVSPGGARAASAGTYILYASHFAAMAPATNIGAATPVQMGGVPSPASDKLPGQSEVDSNEQAKRNKVVNDAVAYIRGLAELRGRNVEWAEAAVRSAASISAEEALAMGVIDIIAKDMNHLLQQLNGRTVELAGREQVLDTEGMVVTRLGPDWRSRFLAIITDPNVAYILMLIGIYGLIFEFSNPGAIVPGVAGAICLLLALFAFQVLPVNYAGLGLMLLGLMLMLAEAFAPSFGALGIGGVIAFVFGSIILMDTDVPGFGVSLGLIGAFGFFSSALFTVVLVMAIKARRRPVVSGQEELIGATAEVIEDFTGDGKVRAHSEIWNARSGGKLKRGQKVRVAAIDGLTLIVEPGVAAEKENNS